MRVQLLRQPYADSPSLREVLEEALHEPETRELTVVVAWAKRSGLTLLEPAIAAFRSRGGLASIVLGIDQGGATRQGLQAAVRLFDAAYAFHDPFAGTFHPKVYWAKQTRSARLLVGSNNLTEGGLRSNYEIALVCSLDLLDQADAAFADDVDSYLGRLTSDSDVCLRLDSVLVEQLADDPRFAVGDEDDRGTAARQKPAASEHSNGPAAQPSLFGRSREPKKRRTATSQDAPRVLSVPPGTPLQQPITASPVVVRWYKRLPASDAQHPPLASSNPTGNLRLTKAESDIDWRRYFRDQLFGDLDWHQRRMTRGTLEYADLPIDVVIHGNYIGPFTLTVDYAAYREAGQANHTTVLHWAGLLPALRAEDYTNDFVIIERFEDGSYRLTITPEEPDGYV